MAIRWNLKKKIIEQFGSQLNFSQKAEISPSELSQIIMGRKPLDPSEQKRWSELLGATPRELFARVK
jgi:hypothetical protein